MLSRVLSILCVVACALTVKAQTPPDHAPFELIAFSGTMARVDIGIDRETARTLRRATILTETGPVGAVLVRTERVCESLCGPDEEKECHYEAVLRASKRLDRAVTVVAGSPDVRDVTAMSSGTPAPLGSPDRWIAAEPIEFGESGYSWKRFPDGVFLTLPKWGRDFYAPPIDLATCSARLVAPFTILSCETAELLYDGSRGVAASLADYGDHLVKPVLRMRLDGREVVVIELGVKAAVTTALLTKGADDRWRLTVREYDYARLC